MIVPAKGYEAYSVIRIVEKAVQALDLTKAEQQFREGLLEYLVVISQ